MEVTLLCFNYLFNIFCILIFLFYFSSLVIYVLTLPSAAQQFDGHNCVAAAF